MKKNIFLDFYNYAIKNLKGNWILLGGGLLNILNIDSRVTYDIDIVPFDKSTNIDTLKLMELASELKLPPEAINQGAEYYLKRIPNWQDNLVEMFKSNVLSIYRPNITLFIILKIGRLSETDMIDIKRIIEFGKKIDEKLNKNILIEPIEIKMKNSTKEQKKFLKELQVTIQEY